MSRAVLSYWAAVYLAATVSVSLHGQPAPGATVVPALVLSPSGQPLKILSGHRRTFSQIAPVGDLPATTNLSLSIALALRHGDQLQERIRQINDPASTNYDRHLTREQFIEQFSPTEDEYQAAIAYATAHGLKVTSTYSNRLLFDVTGSVANIEKVFHVKMRLYPHPTERRLFYGPDRDPSVEPQFGILDVNGLNNFDLPHPLDLKLQSFGTNDFQTFSRIGSGFEGGLIGSDYRHAYAPGVTLDGHGQSIAIVALTTYFPPELANYQQLAGLTSFNVTNIMVNGFNDGATNGMNDGETALDIELAMSMAPGATVMVYQANDMIDDFNQIASDDIAKQVTCSFGHDYGDYPDPTMLNIVAEMNAQGQWLFIASGDSGAQNLSFIEPGGYTNETICGGTDLRLTGQGGGRATETVWSGSGGGWYPQFPLPGYQQGINMTANNGSTQYRNSPDVGMASINFSVVVAGANNLILGGGTSGASPLWAGFLAMVNEQRADNGLSSIGNLNDLLYAIGKGPNYSSAFNDITTGNNTNSTSPNNFFAVPGYDLCTGWGSPNGTNLINFLSTTTDKLQITPGFGFSATEVYNSAAPAASVTFKLINSSSSQISWNVSGGAAWLQIPSSGTTIPANGSAQATISLTSAANNLAPGTYYATVTFADATTGVSQNRLFVLTVTTGAQPLSLSGYNAGVVVPASGTITRPQATNFGVGATFTFYQAGLPGSTLGLPATGRFQSAWDGRTVFQLGPYGANDVLLLGTNYPTSGTLTLTTPQSLDSLVILAASAFAQSTSMGTCTVHFSGGSSQTFAYNAQDWFGTVTNAALMAVGRINLATFATEDDGTDPRLYQTTIPLGELGLTQAVTSVTFNQASNAANTGIFALSGVTGPLSGLAPSITGQPQSSVNGSIYANSAFTVGVAGATPFNYQWYSNSVPLPDGVQPTLEFYANVPTNDAATYYVVVANQFGSVQSSNATLTVVRTPPQFVQQPALTNYTVFAGDTISLTALATNLLPISYSWQLNGTSIPGATSTNLVLNNLQTASTGTYTLVATTTAGTATSIAVTVNVVSRPTTAYSLAVLRLNPASFWRLDEINGSIAYDYVGGDNGSYTNVTLGEPGYGGTPGTGTDPSELAALFGPTNGAQSYVGLPNFDVSVPNGGNGEFAIATWVRASNNTNLVAGAGIVAKGYGNGDEEFALDCGSTSNAFRFFVRNDQSGVAFDANSLVPPDNNWHFLVGVCDQANSTLVLYVDGTNAAQVSITAGTGIHHSTYQGSIGARASSTGMPEDLQFLGTIDDVALFTNALNAGQVALLYNAAAYGPFIQQQPVSIKTQLGNSVTNAVAAIGTNLVYQWFGPEGAVAGATNASLVLSNAQLAQSGYYYVTVTNAYGLAESSSALIVVLPPVTSKFAQSLLALGPLAYWRLDETNGTTAYDYANFNEGTYNNVVLAQPGYGSQSAFSADPAGLSAQFVSNGLPSYVGIPTIDLSFGEFDPAEFSIAAWVKVDPSVASGAGIVAKGAGGAEQFCLDCGGTNDGFRFFYRNGGGVIPASAASSVAPDNHWHFVVGVCDQADNQFSLYIDGTNYITVIQTGLGGALSTSDPASIGARQSGPGQPENLQFVGNLDDVAIFKSALTAGQIANLYSNAVGAPVTEPVVFNGIGVGWSSNQSGAYTTSTITNNVLRLTDGAGSEARSAFFQLPQYVGAFQASFTYQDVGGGGADGIAFVLQNDPRGTSALGGIGNSVGYGLTNPITPSAALELNIYAGGGENVGYAFLTNGLTGAGGANGNYHAPGSINLAGGDPIGITMNYAGSQLALTFTDAVASASFSTNLNVGHLTNVVGGATAYVGFTGADGGTASIQIITNFSFVSIPTETISVAAGQAVISWPAIIAGFTLQQNSNLATTNWVEMTNLPTVVNGQNQFVVPLSITNEYYRLKLP